MRVTQFRASSRWMRWSAVLGLLFALGALGPLLVSASPAALPLRRPADSLAACLASLSALQKDRTYLTDVEQNIHQKGHDCQALQRQATGTTAFRLVPRLTKVSNPHSGELTIDAAAGRGVVKHCCDGGGWNVKFAFKVPQTLTPGKTARITLGLRIDNVHPKQPLLMQITVLAPDFAQAFSIDYPHPSSGSKTFEIPISASSRSAKEITIQIGFYSANVTYTYRP